MDATVTREKHPGRVASGKRLVEWNRNNNKKGLQEPKEEAKKEAKKEPAQEPQVNSSQVIYAGSGVIVVAALLAAWYFLRKKPAEVNAERHKVQTTSPLKKHDIYSMR